MSHNIVNASKEREANRRLAGIVALAQPKHVKLAAAKVKAPLSFGERMKAAKAAKKASHE